MDAYWQTAAAALARQAAPTIITESGATEPIARPLPDRAGKLDHHAMATSPRQSLAVSFSQSCHDARRHLADRDGPALAVVLPFHRSEVPDA